MRRVLLVAIVMAACAKSDTAATDSAALAAAAPAALTADMIAGTWNGTSMAEGSDSVVNRWTVIGGAAGTEGKLILEGSADTIRYTTVFDADSMVATSLPYTPPTPAGSPQVTFRSVGRLVDGKLVGTSANMLAAMPDSVVGRVRWEATRTP